jgi:deoxyribodipyrimidine photolyase-related protein
MKRSLVLFSHQLHPLYIERAGVDKKTDDIIFIDSKDQWTRYQFHQQRLVLHFAAVAHRIEELTKDGWNVRLIEARTFEEALSTLKSILCFTPTNFYEQAWIKKHPQIQELSDPIFLITPLEWNQLLPVQKTWKLDPIYQQFRKRFSVLMNGDKPIGDRYSYDSENRQGPSEDLTFHPPIWFKPDTITKSVMQTISTRFSNHPGKLDSFAYPVTRKQALEAFQHFLKTRLATFGTHQDAMINDDPWMSHSLISSSLNIGLLSPMEVIDGAEQTYQKGQASLSATEGFIRQILGWREYIRGVYLVLGPDYLKVNHFQHQLPLPNFYYDAKTDMHCLKTTIQETIDHGYNHHIQRLMVLSNYANLAEVSPQEVNRWFNEMYIDSSEWVVAANVLGMGLHADGGKMATKPYISSGAYLHKMSNYCESCPYQVKLKTGEKACPFNSLYWHYIDQKSPKLRRNPRMSMMVKVLEKMPKAEKDLLIKQAKRHLEPKR